MTDAEPQDQPDATTSEVDEGRVSRRAAMKVAIGGAAAAAVWTAPRIEGLSLAPDYAAASSSCNTGSGAVLTFNSNNCGYYGDTECWGNNCCGAKGYGPVTVSGKFVVSGNVTGDVSGDNGAVNFAVNGIDPPFQSCTINVAGNCNANANFRNNQNYTFNANGNGSGLLDCQGGGSFVQSDADGQVRVNMTCTCL